MNMKEEILKLKERVEKLECLEVQIKKLEEDKDSLRIRLANLEEGFASHNHDKGVWN